MSLATSLTPDPIDHRSARAAAEHHLLHARRLPTGSRELLARLLAAGDTAPTVERLALEFGVSLSTASLWIARSKRAGLLSVTRVGRCNRYSINFEALQRLADERAGR